MPGRKESSEITKDTFFSADVALDAAARTKLQGVWCVYRENENGIRVLKFHAKADKKGRFSVIFHQEKNNH